MISDIIEKVALKQDLDEVEISDLRSWFAQSDTERNPPNYLSDVSPQMGIVTGGVLNALNAGGIILDLDNQAISISNATFGSSGVQIQYNNGTPQMYLGNGAAQYMQYQAGALTLSGAITTGAVTAGAGAVTLDADGITIAASADAKAVPNSVTFEYGTHVGTAAPVTLSAYYTTGGDEVVGLLEAHGNAAERAARVQLSAKNSSETEAPYISVSATTVSSQIYLDADSVYAASTLNVTGAATFNSSISVGGGVALAVVTTGSYTPTLYNTTNVAASTAGVCYYTRVGNMCIVSGPVNIDATGAGAIVLGMDFPIASTTSAQGKCAGVASTATAAQPLIIRADTANNRAYFNGVVTDTGNDTYLFTFQYLIT